MKTIIATLLFVPMALALTACFPDDGSWKEKYGSPELFLSHIEGTPNLYLYEDEVQYPDVDFEVRDLILESGPFDSIGEKAPASERYFTYEAYWHPATSGPNYCKMSIWDDGLVRIDHKKSLGLHSYLYFSMDPAKALRINDVVFEKLGQVKTIRDEDEAQAKLDGAIQPPHRYGGKPSVAAQVYDRGQLYSFSDRGEVLEVLKSATYVPISQLSSAPRFWYHCGESWSLELWGTSVVRLDYRYQNRLGESKGVVLIYSIEPSQGQAIVEKAVEVANRS